METRAFAPLYTKANPGTSVGSLLASVTVAATTTAATGTLTSGTNSNQIQVANQTTAWAFVNFGTSTALTAATAAASLPVPPSTSRIFSVDSEVSSVSVILSTGSGNVSFTRGEG